MLFPADKTGGRRNEQPRRRRCDDHGVCRGSPRGSSRPLWGRFGSVRERCRSETIRGHFEDVPKRFRPATFLDAPKTAPKRPRNVPRRKKNVSPERFGDILCAFGDVSGTLRGRAPRAGVLGNVRWGPVSVELSHVMIRFRKNVEGIYSDDQFFSSPHPHQSTHQFP